MNERNKEIAKAIWLMGQFKDCHKTTVGEVARATGIPYTSVKRRLEKLWDSGLVSFEEYRHKSVIARDFRLSLLGVKFFGYEEVLGDD